MAVFRPEDDLGLEDNSPADEEDNFDEPEETLPARSGHQDEKRLLNRQRQPFNEAGLDYDNGAADGRERQALDELEDDEPEDNLASTIRAMGGRQLRKNTLPNFKNKKYLLGGALVIPVFIGLILLVFALQSGLVLEHIQRVSTGLRFGAVHFELSRRFNHLRREYTRLEPTANVSGRQVAPYAKTTLGSRLLAVDPGSIYDHLKTKGYKFEYTTLSGGSVTAKGRKTLTKAILPDGSVREIRSSADALEFLKSAGKEFDDTRIERYRAWRGQMLLGKQIGIPFIRFRATIEGLRDGSLKNIVRGSPVPVSKEIQADKRRLANKLPDLRNGLQRFGVDGLADAVSEDATKNIGPTTLDDNMRKSLSARKTALSSALARSTGAAAGTSVALSVITLACVLREIGVIIRSAFKMKTRGMQDSAATLRTTASQIKAGYAESAVVSDMTRRFTGFAASANYQLATGNQSAASLAGVEGVDFSEELSPANIFGGWVVSSLLKFSDLVSPSALLNSIKQAVKIIPGFLGNLAGRVLGDQFARACGWVLTAAFQFALIGLELLATIVATIFSGGLAGGAAIGAGQVVKQVSSTLVTSVIIGSVAGLALDALIYDYLLPGMIKNAAGLDTALLASDDPDNGARNYAIVDYGMQHLSTAETLAGGGSRMPAAEATAQAQAYLAEERQAYSEKGLANNILSFENPYSLASSILTAQNTGGSWQQRGQTYVASLFSGLASSFDVSQTAYAAEGDQLAAQQILYPDQEQVIGFNRGEIEGSQPLFTHTTNTVFVEDNLEQLRNEYSLCLSVSADEYLLGQVSGGLNEYGQEYYPEKCDQLEARRYKMYYQDCTLIESIRLWGTNDSPMFSSRCDHLLPEKAQDILNEPAEAAPEGEQSNLSLSLLSQRHMGDPFEETPQSTREAVFSKDGFGLKTTLIPSFA